jgi:hypothetical protein
VTLPHTLKRIRLNLARSKEFPSGSSRHGYDLLAPLDEFGRIDPQLWRRYQDHCRVRRFWQGEEDQIACLVHRPGGAEHARWVFGYDPERGWIDDEVDYRFGAHKFAPGEYVSILSRRSARPTGRRDDQGSGGPLASSGVDSQQFRFPTRSQAHPLGPRVP